MSHIYNSNDSSVINEVKQQLAKLYPGANHVFTLDYVKGVRSFTPEVIDQLLKGSHGAEGILAATRIQLEQEKQRSLQMEAKLNELYPLNQLAAHGLNKVIDENNLLKEEVKTLKQTLSNLNKEGEDATHL